MTVVAIDLDAVAERLFAGVMAPLVLGGSIRPGHAIGARRALALGEGRLPADQDLGLRVAAARLHRARRLVPIDALPDPSGADWALGAALHDMFQSVNPAFDAPFRRRAAARILELAGVVIEKVPLATTVAQALARHTWLARAPEVARTDTTVRWWSGSAVFLGEEPPPRLQAWPQFRRVEVVRTPRPLLDVTPIAVDRDRLTETLAAFLSRTPLTDLATCTRPAPAFAWHATTLDFLATTPGRALALRALARLPTQETDAALGHATRSLLAAGYRHIAAPALALLADRALADAQRRMESGGGPRGVAPIGGASARTEEIVQVPARGPAPDGAFGRAIGALVAHRELRAGKGPWSDEGRLRLIGALSATAQSAAAREASAFLERGVQGRRNG
jgi:hypothetical protein